MKLAERLVKLRKAKGLTQNDVAGHLGISRGAYANYELGTREPDTDTLIKLAELYGVTVDYLLGRSNVPVYTNQDTHMTMDEEWMELIRQIRELGTELEATALLRSATQMSKEQLRDILKVFQMIKKDREQNG